MDSGAAAGLARGSVSGSIDGCACTGAFGEGAGAFGAGISAVPRGPFLVASAMGTPS